MTTYSRSEKTVTTVTYRVPAPEPLGAPYTEVLRAINAASREFLAEHDDDLRVHANDDMIIISFEKATRYN